MTVTATVLAVSRPVVAASEGTWQVEVTYGETKTWLDEDTGEVVRRVKKHKRTVFTTELPKLYSKIQIKLI